MTTDQTAKVLESRLTALASIDSASFADRVLKVIREWMLEVMDLPPKEVVLNATALALDRVFGTIDTPGPDVLVEPVLKSTIITLVGFGYDAIAKETI